MRSSTGAPTVYRVVNKGNVVLNVIAIIVGFCACAWFIAPPTLDDLSPNARSYAAAQWKDPDVYKYWDASVARLRFPKPMENITMPVPGTYGHIDVSREMDFFFSTTILSNSQHPMTVSDFVASVLLHDRLNTTLASPSKSISVLTLCSGSACPVPFLLHAFRNLTRFHAVKPMTLYTLVYGPSALALPIAAELSWNGVYVSIPESLTTDGHDAGFPLHGLWRDSDKQPMPMVKSWCYEQWCEYYPNLMDTYNAQHAVDACGLSYYMRMNQSVYPQRREWSLLPIKRFHETYFGSRALSQLRFDTVFIHVQKPDAIAAFTYLAGLLNKESPLPTNIVVMIHNTSLTGLILRTISALAKSGKYATAILFGDCKQAVPLQSCNPQQGLPSHAHRATGFRLICGISLSLEPTRLDHVGVGINTYAKLNHTTRFFHASGAMGVPPPLSTAVVDDRPVLSTREAFISLANIKRHHSVPLLLSLLGLVGFVVLLWTCSKDSQ